MAKSASGTSHVFAGVSFPGRDGPARIVKELERRAAGRKDQLVRADRMKFVVLDGSLLLRYETKESNLVPLNRTAWSQVAAYAGIPTSCPFWAWITAPKHWEKAVTALNAYFADHVDVRLLRILERDGQPYLRAFLSDKYAIVDHYDFMFAIAERLKAKGAEIWHCRLSEDDFFGYAVAPGITSEVSVDRTFDPGDGWKSRWYGREGDVSHAAMAFGNSETGGGSCFLGAAVLRRVCQNYRIYHDLVSRTHIGRKKDEGAVLSAETIKAENQVFFMKIGDNVDSVFDPEKFVALFAKEREAAADSIDPKRAEEAGEALRIVFDLPQERAARIKSLFMDDGDYSRYGLANAVSRAAHDHNVEAAAGYAEECGSAKLIECSSFSSFLRRASNKARTKGESEVAEKLSAAIG